MKIFDKLSKIQLLAMDVDGVLTNGYIVISNNGYESKCFNIKDGLGIKLIQNIGVIVAIITRKSSNNIITSRFFKLGVKEIFQGQKNKLNAFQKLKQKYDLNNYQIGYIGDDLPDLPIIKKAGFSAAPKDSISLVKNSVDYVCRNYGGQGAVREVCDLVLDSKGLLSKTINNYIYKA